MKHKELDVCGDLLGHDSPATKLPHEFTGNGLEIIGEPNKNSGELWYHDGRCALASSASPAYEDLPPSKRPRITVGKLAAWFNLEQKHKLENQPPDAVVANSRGDEREAADRAAMLASAFADAMLRGRLMPLIREVEDEYSREAKRAQARQGRNMPKDGIQDALAVIAKRSTHPDQITVSAVIDFLNSENEFCKYYGITQSMKSPREVRKRLELIGFGWIGHGRKRGQKRSQPPCGL